MPIPMMTINTIHTYTYTHTDIYIYILIDICVCVEETNGFSKAP